MNHHFFKASCCLSLLTLFLVTAEPSRLYAEDHQLWESDLNAAIEKARETKRPLLLHFYASWCGPCRLMDRDVFSSSYVARQLKQDVIAVKVDSDKNPELVKRFGVGNLPSDVFIDADGRVLAKSVGLRGSNEYVSLASKVKTRYTQELELRLLRKSNGRELPPKTNQVVQQEANEPQGESVAIAMKGYSPVALRESRKWKKGMEEFVVQYQGMRYFLASAEEQERFREEPSKYVPQLLGCDPVLMWESDRAIPGDTRYGAFYNGELYFFANAENRKIFKVDPGKYARLRHVLDVQDLELETVIR